VVTACQQACPTRAITFGSISDPQSAVAQALEAPHAYGVLESLGTRPRTRYLARVRNRNDEVDGAGHDEPDEVHDGASEGRG